MKVLLANPPWINDKEYIGIRAGSRWPHLRMKKESLPYFPFPFSLAYAAAVLKKENPHTHGIGMGVYLKDCIAEEIDKDKFLDILTRLTPDIVVFETSTPSIENDLEYTRLVKDKFKTITILCGPHATAMPEEMLKNPYVDYVMLGEYEYVLRDLIKAIEKGQDTSSIKGVCSKNNGKIVINERAPLIEELDNLPYPVRENSLMNKYVDGFCKHIPNVQMITSRGCPYKCIFCLEPSVYYGKPNYRVRSPQSVVDEMEYLVRNFKAREIYFDDSSFSIDQTRVKEICREIIKRKLKVYWSCMADAKLRDDTLRMMKKANCVGLKFGVESADPKLLENINKQIKLEEVKNLVRTCRKVGIESHATYAFGLPGETKQTLKKTIDFAFSLGTDTAQFSVAIPYPGTLFYRMAKENNWLITDRWSDFDGQKISVVEYPDLKKEDILSSMQYCRKKIVLKTIKNPRLLMQYLIWIKRYSGFRGLISTLASKSRYVIKGILLKQ